MKTSAKDVTLFVDADELFLPLVTAFVEKSANCFGLSKDESLRLTLASEEVFMHLCKVVMSTGGAVEIVCSNGGYYTQAVFLLPTDSFDMRAFNLTTAISTEDDADLDAMGLLIASRSIDRFMLSPERGGKLRLTLIKEKAYPVVEARSVLAGPLTIASLRSPGAEEVKFISQLAVSCYDSRALSDILLYPGKLVDMITAGEYASLAAVGSAGEIGGAIFWRGLGENIVECFGPYVFSRGPASSIADDLLEGCIGAVARTHAIGIINTRPTPEFSRRHFELLGTFDACAPDGSFFPEEAWFRLIGEDTGAAVWVHPGIDAFVRREYARLVLPREIRIDQPSGEGLPRHSVLSAEFDRLQGRVTLRPMWPGVDVDENIERHIRLLQAEKILNIHFALDLGLAWQSVFVPALLNLGFDPRFVMPYAGKGDIVILQFREKIA